ncbi:hypothetical protein G4G28_15530 [Massilia sp. Dwa41.01b]|uniref:hypothetical protein n=1 Tax=unclassified Massilia TaxID=2609279 RepID=UPI001602FEBA|nr:MULTISPECIES: hypothetical protein [unclassified Massilia]QNA89522.1 hypothetical protein G4G28_15530 [Massilia sp. Dwa41.01b]QNB00421.1 hypothetical protein G4G31_19115 [Massilia sp. Se16.2.3]
MSIAVSVHVAPSRQLRACLGLFALLQFACAVAVPAMLSRIAYPGLCAAFFLLAASFLLYGCVSATKPHQIDVSGTGAMRLTVQQEMGADPVAPDGIVVTLLPGTLVWPRLMLLRLGDGHGGTRVVPVLRDSLAAGDFQALRVAVGTLCGRLGPEATTNEIL